AEIEIAIVVVLELAGAAAVENVERIEPAGQCTQDILKAVRVVAPDDRSALLLRVVDAGSQRQIVEALAGDAGADADGLHELLDVEEHDVAVAFAVRQEVVAMLLAVVEKDAGRVEPGQVADRVFV